MAGSRALAHVSTHACVGASCELALTVAVQSTAASTAATTHLHAHAPLWVGEGEALKKYDSVQECPARERPFLGEEGSQGRV